MNKEGKKQIIVVPSTRMDDNKKRDEHTLIRLPEKTRSFFNFKKNVVKLKPYNNTNEIELEVHTAFVEDLKELKRSGRYDTNELCRIGFVSSKIYNTLMGAEEGLGNKRVWIFEEADEVIIGADPEFILKENNLILDARNYLSHDGLIGADGPMAEIRPRPSTNIGTLVANMKNIFQSGQKLEIKDFEWVPGCYFADKNRDYPVGGHIHFGNPKRVEKMSEVEKTKLFCVMNKIVDELLSIVMIKLDGEKGGE